MLLNDGEGPAGAVAEPPANAGGPGSRGHSGEAVRHGAELPPERSSLVQREVN